MTSKVDTLSSFSEIILSIYVYKEASSLLGASKLRKFYDHYLECYQKALTHKKLMNAVQKA